MKYLYDIGQRIQTLNKEITKLQSEIIDVLEYQRSQGVRPNRDCDVIAGSEMRVSIIEGEIRDLKLVADEGGLTYG